MKTDHLQVQQPLQADKHIIMDIVMGSTQAMLPRLPSKCHTRTSQQHTLLVTDFSSVNGIRSTPHHHSKRAKVGCCKPGLGISLSLCIYIFCILVIHTVQCWIRILMMRLQFSNMHRELSKMLHS